MKIRATEAMLGDLIYRRVEGMLNNFKNKRITYTEAIEFVQEFMTQARQNERTRVMNELLQKFNDYEVPLSMTANEIREIITEYLSN